MAKKKDPAPPKHGVIKCGYDAVAAIADLKPHPKNPNKHSKQQIEHYGLIMRKNGVRQPVRVSKQSGFVTKGHGQILAATREGWTHVPIEYQDYDSPALEFADLTADNALALQAELDLVSVTTEVANYGPDFDLGILGIQDFELEAADNRSSNDKEDVVPEVPAVAKSKRGQIYKLGDHRIMCGDSTSKEDVAALMGDVRARLMNTDPPYGIDYSKKTSSASAKAGWQDIANDDLLDEKLQEFLTAVFRTAAELALDRSAAWYLWHAHLTQGYFAAAAAAANVVLHRQIIWVKPNFIFGRGQYHWRHEPCFMGWIKGNQPPFYGERNQSTVWEFSRDASGNDRVHPTQKPVALFEAPITNHSNRGEAVYEPFSGSGSQIIAAEKLGRRCFAMEVDARYVDVAIARWEKFTGQKAVLVWPARRAAKPKSESTRARSISK